MKKALTILVCIGCIVILQNCGSSKKASKTATAMAVSFDKDVMPIMQSRCTPCHFPPDGRKKALNTYDAVKANIADIIARVKLPQTDNGFMPWKNKKPALSDSLINVLVEWQKQNMPQ
ncbi:hypothetical protein [Ferruginibacter sp. SUN106]|uniref:hypothetical protein n=1 Tax=Ferruginibacter sp. SUN106 TaxID=2978348 RepID=UPI003D35B875